MLDLKLLRENPEKIKEGLRAKNSTLELDDILRLDETRRTLIQETESLKSLRNKANEEISALKRSGQSADAKVGEMKTLSARIAELDTQGAKVDEELFSKLHYLPNPPHESVPRGGPSENKIVKEWGTLEPKFLKSAQPRTHVELSESLGWISSAKGAKLTGSGWLYYQGMGARLERALINFMLDLHTREHGYEEVSPPFIVSRQTMTGTGQLPKMEEDMYRLRDEDFFLIPTAEVPVTNALRDAVLKAEELPKKFVAYTPCFRREAGSYGKDTKGLARIHQFDKVELVKFAKPENSYDELESLRADAERVLQLLGLPYRVVLLASGDLSFAAAKCYDLEVWAPGSEKWFEVSSCSNFEDFQARRINVKFKRGHTAKPELVHTLNGSGVALPRTVIGILENFQKDDGTIQIPEVLQKYL
ncbi:MAG: serine--tRNA ligase [Candidatus Omnitrophica bacterium]|nr:serine--tRNA ligase [Candidatus Omnitrophota bacterium]